MIGALMTRKILSLLEPLALACMSTLGADQRTVAEASYRAVSAKLWPSEPSLALKDSQRAEPELLIERWRHARDIWLADPSKECFKAGWGIQAPVPPYFEIKGGFVDAAGSEWIPASKQHRAEEIHRWGWS